MKRLRFTATLSLCLLLAASAAPSGAQPAAAAPKGETRTFELTPTAPPVPTLKHQLLFDDLGDRRPGNAALLYLDAILLMPPDAKEQAQKAMEAFEAKDTRTFEAIADGMNVTNVLDELDLAGRREECEWQPPFHEMGAYTLLPHLGPLVQGCSRIVKVRALRQIEQGKIDEARVTLRLGYEMSNKVGHETILISGLVANRMTGDMNDALANLMNHPQAMNLYWALTEIPPRHGIFLRAMDGERQWWVTTLPSSRSKERPGEDLAQLAKNGADLSAEQWRALIDYVWGLVTVGAEGQTAVKRVDPVTGATPENLKNAREQYAKVHHVSADQAAKVEPVVVLGEYYFAQYVVVWDDMFKLRNLPYPILLPRSTAATAAADKISKEQPANPFLYSTPSLHRGVWAFAKTDRQLAALTAVEAIRSYAAANGGALPKRLEDVIETPIPQNPATGKPFEYRVQDDVATLADTASEEPLTYTIRIRK
jgi:hypothetical protein